MKTVTEITAEKKEASEIRLAAYCRVSSGSADQRHSFAAQIQYYADYCKQNPQYKLVDVYADEAVTGTCAEKRDDFLRLMRDCRKGKIDRIIVKSVSRFARNTQELLAALRMLSEHGVSVFFEEQGIDTARMDNEMIITFPGMAAQQESLAISGNVRWSYRKRMASGEFNCTYPAYGFRLIDGKLQINETEAAVVRRIFALYLQGLGRQAIADVLNQEGIRTRREGKQWRATGISYLLGNERYVGDALLQKKYTTQTLPFREKYNHGELPQYYVENSNPAIISREDFAAVQALRRQRQQVWRTDRGKHRLSGLLRCPDCGRSLRRLCCNGTAYWSCAFQNSGASTCRKVRVREEEVINAFSLLLRKLRANREHILPPLIQQLTLLNEYSCGNQARLHEIDKVLADRSAQKLVVTRLHTKGILTASDYAAQADVLDGAINHLRLERRRLLAEAENDGQLDDLRILNQLLETGEDDDGILEQIVTEIAAVRNEELRFKLLGGLELTEIIPEKGRCTNA
mgnify:FL=1